MVSEDKHYEFITDQIKDRCQQINAAFNLYIKMFSAIIAGTIWLSTQPQIPRAKAALYEQLSDAFVILVTLIVSLTIIENIRSWHGYRKALCKFGDEDLKSSRYIPPPRPFRASWIEGSMVASIVIAAALFCLFNPFAH